MKDIAEYDRPNTVSGLRAKRKEMIKLLGKITADAERARSSIKSIDACIKLFDPSAKPPATYHDGIIPRHTAPKGHLKRFILNMLREASMPLSARQIADAWVIEQMIEGDTRFHPAGAGMPPPAYFIGAGIVFALSSLTHILIKPRNSFASLSMASSLNLAMSNTESVMNR